MIERSGYDDSPTFWDVVEILRMPLLSAVATAAVTWLIWYYTSTPCTSEVARLTGCNPAAISRYIDVEIFGRMLTYSVLVGGIGGLWKYDMIRKERAARIAAQNQLVELQKQWQEERQSFLATLAEERELAARERQELIATIAGLVSQVDRLVQHQNGNHGSNGDSSNGH